jgi:uncharacterized oligopeptide transporter (OPT) family protein
LVFGFWFLYDFDSKTGYSFGSHIQGAILPFALVTLFQHQKLLPWFRNFGPLENGFVQTVVVAVSSAAIGAGFTGPLIAINMEVSRTIGNTFN